jgi:hypothetical protein
MVIAQPEDGQHPICELVRRFWYATTLTNARYRLDLGPAAVRMDLTLTEPYVLSVAHTWQRVACSNVDYTQLLDRTDRALQNLTNSALSWRHSLIASERGGFLSSYARLNGDHFTAFDLARLREQLPRGWDTRYRSYSATAGGPPPPEHGRPSN